MLSTKLPPKNNLGAIVQAATVQAVVALAAAVQAVVALAATVQAATVHRVAAQPVVDLVGKPLPMRGWAHRGVSTLSGSN